MRAFCWLGIAAILAGCSGSPPKATVDRAAEAAKVRARNAAFDAALQRKDLESVVAAYAPDAVLLWQNDPRMSGPAIRQAWVQSLGLAGFGLHLHSRTIAVAEAGDLALDEGTLELQLPGATGVTRAPGKYLVVWKKVGNDWKVLYDAYNLDAAGGPTLPAQ